MPNHTLEEVALNILQQRGLQPTPQNFNAIKSALEANPELLDNVQGSFRRQQAPVEADRTQSVNPIVFRDAFDQALEQAINGGVAVTPATPAALDGTPTQPAPPVDINAGNQPAPPIIDVVTQILAAQGASAGATSPIEQALSVPPSGGAATPPPTGEGDDIPLIAPAFRPKEGVPTTQGERLPAVGRGRGVAGPGQAQVGGGPAPLQLEGPQRALPAPEPVPENPVRAPRAAQPSVTSEVSTAVDAGDAADAGIKRTKFAGKDAAQFRFEGQTVVVTEDGQIAIKDRTRGGDLFDVREPGLLERIRAFLTQHADEFRTIIRAAR